MGCEHHTVGFSTYEKVLEVLKALDVPHDECGEGLVKLEPVLDEVSRARWLRKTTFEGPRGKMVAEEYLAVLDNDCDGTSVINVEIYQDGQRPSLAMRTSVVWGKKPAI